MVPRDGLPKASLPHKEKIYTTRLKNEVNDIHRNMCSSNNPVDGLGRNAGGHGGDMPGYTAGSMCSGHLIIITTVKAVLRKDKRAEAMSVSVLEEP
uniref:Uncharacterized protein n=1 Tax=Lactuca sativa TaxID=4236 RepID=A0A9R1UU09_LACSA|nr:hypothetical protein LSAT_V11C800446350 [Lactuca sativa]